MQRGWYLRLLLMVAVTTTAWLVLWPSLDAWLPAPRSVEEHVTGRISPGLDIRGGLRLTYDVDIAEAVRDRRDLRADELDARAGRAARRRAQRGRTRRASSWPRSPKRSRSSATASAGSGSTFKNAADAGKLDHELVTRYGDLREVSNANGEVVLEVRADFLEQIQETAVQQARETIENRVDELGVREASVTAQNTDIIVEVPGADQAAFDRIREIISKTARLEFQIVDDEATFVDELTDLPAGIDKQTEVVSAGHEQAAGAVAATWSRRARMRARSSATTSRSSRPRARSPRTTSC